MGEVEDGVMVGDRSLQLPGAGWNLTSDYSLLGLPLVEHLFLPRPDQVEELIAEVRPLSARFLLAVGPLQRVIESIQGRWGPSSCCPAVRILYSSLPPLQGEKESLILFRKMRRVG
jgi:hypothetical protein